MSADRFARAIAAIDAANARDPNRIAVRGRVRPKELAHAELASEWIERLCPEPGEALRLAARAHHLERWTRPRSDHPAGRAAYLQWRAELQRLHADRVGEILAGEGYSAEEIRRVQDLVRKRDLRHDPEVQALEDALCLVFLETQLADLVRRVEPEKMVSVLRKTLSKMSESGRRLAHGLDYGAAERALLERALADSRADPSDPSDTSDTPDASDAPDPLAGPGPAKGSADP